MSEIDSIIQITITRETTAVATASFNIPLVLAQFTNFAERTRTYTDIDEVAEDFDSADNVYKMAQRLFGQDLGVPPSIVVGRRQVDGVDGSIISPTSGVTYSVTINGTEYSYTAGGGTTATIITTALKTAYELAPKVGITFTDNLDGTFDVQVDDAGDEWSIVSSSTVSLTDIVPSESWTEALDAVIAENNDWYALVSEVHTKTEQLELTAAIQAQHKIYVTSTTDVNSISTATTDLGYLNKNSGVTRTSTIYLPTASTEFPEAAWVGALLPQVVGAASWNFKRAALVSASNLSSTARTNLRNKNVNMFTTVAGVNIFQDGVMADGRPMSEIIISDWIHARMQEQIYFRLINLLKIPFTRAGFAVIEGEMRSVLQQAQSNGAIDTFSVISPDPLAIPSNQRAQGIAGTFTFTARLAGEVKNVIIRGTLTI
jgi:hypothetical protein